MKAIAPIESSVLLELVDGHPTTSSLDVAAHFGKLHKDVLKRITRLDCSQEFTERNFAPSEYTDLTGRSLPQYRMTRDGFTFLCMGFTGKEAAKWKEAYINAFNQMEETLLAGKQEPTNVATLQRVFHGRSVYFAFHEGKPWVSAANICSALGIGATDKLMRKLTEHQTCRLMRGTVGLRMIDMPAALRAADHCNRDTAEEYRQWLQDAQTELRASAPAPQGEWLPGADKSDIENAARRALSTARFLCSFDFDGKMLMSEVPKDAVVMPTHKLAGFIGDPTGIPRELLGDILEAVGRRMKALH